MNIADIDNAIGKMKIYIQNTDIDGCPYFDDYFVINAFYNTMYDIELLENTIDVLKIKNSRNAVAQWFLAIESFISSILKIVCIETEQDFDVIKKQDLPQRIGKLVELLGYNKDEVYKNNIKISKVNEFCTFRNELFHDRYNSEPQIYKHTKFINNTYLLRQSDVIQALIIALEVFTLFRFCFAKMDLMPDIYIEKQDTFGYIKLDTLYNELVLPCWTDVLSKHKLKCDIDTNILTIPLTEGTAFDTKGIKMIIKAETDSKYPFNRVKTSICKEKFERIKSKLNINEGCFQLGNYNR